MGFIMVLSYNMVILGFQQGNFRGYQGFIRVLIIVIYSSVDKAVERVYTYTGCRLAEYASLPKHTEKRAVLPSSGEMVGARTLNQGGYP